MFDIADSVPIAWDVKDSAGVLTDASTVSLTVTKPDGTTETPTVPAPSTPGEYRVTYVPAVEGRFAWRAVTTVPNTAIQGVFTVRSEVSPALLSLAEVKKHLNIPDASTANDEELRDYIESATGIVESFVGPVVRRTHTARVSGYRAQIALPHTQVQEILSVTVVRDGSTPVTLSDLTVNSESGVVSFKNGAMFPYGDMDIEYVVFRNYVNPNWIVAARIIIQHNWRTKLGDLPSVQGDDRGYVVTGSGYLIPFRAKSLLEVNQVPAGFA